MPKPRLEFGHYGQVYTGVRAKDFYGWDVAEITFNVPIVLPNMLYTVYSIIRPRGKGQVVLTMISDVRLRLCGLTQKS